MLGYVGCGLVRTGKIIWGKIFISPRVQYLLWGIRFCSLDGVVTTFSTFLGRKRILWRMSILRPAQSEFKTNFISTHFHLRVVPCFSPFLTIHPLRNRHTLTVYKMIIPVRCFTCNKTLGGLQESYQKLVYADVAEGYIPFLHIFSYRTMKT